MDSGELISMVQQRRCLWDPKEPQYHMRNITTMMWKEIAVQLSEPVSEVKKRWRSLRDCFRREVKKCNDSSRTWTYFNQMSFMMEAVPNSGKLHNGVAYDTPTTPLLPGYDETLDASDTNETYGSANEDKHGEEDGGASRDFYPELTPITQIKTFDTPPPTLKKKRDYEERLLQIKSKKLRLLERAAANQEDSDYQFLISMLPFLHDVPPQKKLRIRSEMMDVLIRDQEQRNVKTEMYRD